MARPKLETSSEKELIKLDEKFKEFESNVAEMTVDRMNLAPVEEKEVQTKISTREANKADASYLKPVRSINSKEPFNEKYREQHTKAWEYIKCIVENNEIIGEQIECWTKRFAGDPAHFWKVPVNKPVFIPKLLAEQLSQCRYHRLRMDQSQIASSDGAGTFMGSMVVDETKHRVDCRPVGFGFTTLSI